MTHSAREHSGGAERYELIAPVAAGGMATIHLGRMRGAGGFVRHVAIKRLQGHLVKDPELVAMLLDEGRMASRISHPNVVAIIDVVRTDEELFLVMEYVEGVPLSFLRRAVAETAPDAKMPIPVAVAVAVGVLEGLHAAHEAKGDSGEPLGLVHRDVSPQNILLGADGIPRVVDFGIAKAAGRSKEYTREGEVKGKLPYMAPEQLRAGDVDRRVDVWAASVVLWEMLVGTRPFHGDDQEVMRGILYGKPPALATLRADVPKALEAVIRRGLSRFPEDRFATAREMAVELDRAVRPAGTSEVGAWAEELASEEMKRRAALVHDLAQREPERVLETKREARPTLSSATGVGRRLHRQKMTLLFAVLFAVVGIALIAALFARPREATPVLAVSSGGLAEPALEDADASAPEPTAAIGEPPPAASSVARSARPPPSKKEPRSGAPRSSKTAAPRDERCYRLDAAGIWHIRAECL